MLTRLRRVCVLAAALLAPKAVDGKDDGLALTPPMGWSSWCVIQPSCADTLTTFGGTGSTAHQAQHSTQHTAHTALPYTADY